MDFRATGVRSLSLNMFLILNEVKTNLIVMCLLAGILVLNQSGFCRTDPIRSDPIRSVPVRSGPIRSDPILFDPVRSGPVRSGPIRSGFCQRPSFSVKVSAGVETGSSEWYFFLTSCKFLK